MFENKDLTTREKILKTSLAMFGEIGFDGARVDKIAERAGINKAMIYYHFKSKKELYHEVVHYTVSIVAESVKKNIRDEKTLEGILKEIANTYSIFFTKNVNLRQIFVRELANPDSVIIKIISDTVNESGIPQMFGEKFAEGISNHSLRNVDIKQSIISFITMNLGYIILSPVINRLQGIDNMDQFLSERKDAVVDLFLNGVLQK